MNKIYSAIRKEREAAWREYKRTLNTEVLNEKLAKLDDIQCVLAQEYVGTEQHIERQLRAAV